MGTVSELPGVGGQTDADDPGPGSARRRTWLLAAAAVLGPVAATLLLIPWRDRLSPADDALLLVVVIVAVATAGYRWAAAVCALVSALALDVFLTRPYHSLRIERTDDLVTAILLLVVGLAVGDLAARGRTQRAAATWNRNQLVQVRAVTDLAARGGRPDVVVRRTGAELTELLGLRSCLFATSEPGVAARVLPDGRVEMGTTVWPAGSLGLPFGGAVLAARAGGRVQGYFVLEPEPGTPVPQDLLAVAVTMADQVGATLAARGSDGPGGAARPG